MPTLDKRLSSQSGRGIDAAFGTGDWKMAGKRNHAVVNMTDIEMDTESEEKDEQGCVSRKKTRPH